MYIAFRFAQCPVTCALAPFFALSWNHTPYSICYVNVSRICTIYIYSTVYIYLYIKVVGRWLYMSQCIGIAGLNEGIP